MLLLLPLLALSTVVLEASATNKININSIKVPIRNSPGQKQAYRIQDGSYNPAYAKAERSKNSKKYQHKLDKLRKAVTIKKMQRVAASKVKKSTGRVDLTDYIVGITDVEYYGTIGIGTPTKYFTIDFDTGSSDVWLPVVKIAGTAKQFNTKGSTSYSTTGKKASILYGSGNVTGTIASETINFGGFVLPNQIFIAVNSSSGFEGDPATGLFGMGFSSIAESGAPTPMENLIAANQLSSKLFAFYFTRNAVKGSVLTIGGTDSSHYVGDIAYTPLVSQDYWTVQLNAPQVNGKSVGKPFLGAIDTGTTLIYLPTSVADAIYKRIPSSKSDGSGAYTFPCNSNATVALTFSGISQSFPINSADFNLGFVQGSKVRCVGTIMAGGYQDVNGKDFAIIDEYSQICDSFLKNWYSVYSYDAANGSPAVGFAQSR